MGATYISTNSTNPATFFGFGTWTRIEGQFLLGATDGTTGSGASYAAGATGGAAAVTLTSAQSGLPAHNHGTSITQPAFDTPELTHSITQPTFNTPELSHTVTQPVLNNAGSHHHRERATMAGAGWSGTSPGYYNTFSKLSKFGQYGTDFGYLEKNDDNQQIIENAGSHTHTLSTNVGVAKHTAAACSRITNVAVAKHTATACTRSTDVGVTVSNNTAAAATSAHTNMPPFQAVYIWYRSA